MQQDENQIAQSCEKQDYVEPKNLLDEFLRQNDNGERVLLHGLNLMLTTYFTSKRFYETENDTEAVLEAYHFCKYFITHKELFNPKMAE